MAMDDYGTGSASSGIVLYAPMDEIKPDISFIRGVTEDVKKQAMYYREAAGAGGGSMKGKRD